MGTAVTFSLRSYHGEVFAVQWHSRNPSTGSYVCYWLDDQGRLQEGFIGVRDALEAEAVHTPQARALWVALKERFGKVRSRTDWKKEIAETMFGAGSLPDFDDSSDMTW